MGASMHKVRAAIISGGVSAYRLIATKSETRDPRLRKEERDQEPSLNPKLVTRARKDGISRQEIAAAIHNLREESVPEDGSLAHWVTVEEPGEQPLLPKHVRPHQEGEEPQEPSLDGEIVPRRVSRTADTRSEDRVAGEIETATLTFRESEYEVRVVNTSSRGLQVESDLPAHIAEELTIRLDTGIRMPCYVRWIRGGRIGLGFREKDLAD
jgi:hypothetical protein